MRSIKHILKVVEGGEWTTQDIKPVNGSKMPKVEFKSEVVEIVSLSLLLLVAIVLGIAFLIIMQ